MIELCVLKWRESLTLYAVSSSACYSDGRYSEHCSALERTEALLTEPLTTGRSNPASHH